MTGRLVLAIAFMLASGGAAHAQRTNKAAPKPSAAKREGKEKDAGGGTTTDQPSSSKSSSTEASSTTAGEAGKPGKAKVYTFTGLDLEGKLKTPQLLYFLNRVRVELDSSSPGKRSFMKELERSADDPGL